MKKLFNLFFFTLLTFSSFSQADSLSTDSIKSSKFSSQFTIGSKSLWRGIDFGNGSPTLQGLVIYSPFKFIDLSIFGATPLNGTSVGYANTLNVFLTIKHKGFYLELDDYYFKGDQTNIPTDYWDHANTHFVEARLGFKNNRIDIKSGYTVYGGDLYHNPIIDTLGNKLNNTQEFYLEVNIKLTDAFYGFIGGITAPSALNFTDKAGFTNIGLKYVKSVELTKTFSLPVEAVLVFNPSHKNISPKGLPRFGYGSHPVHFIANFCF